MNEIFDTGRDYGVCTSLVIPQPNGTVAMSQKEIPIKIRADYADRLATPPRSYKWSPIFESDETCNNQYPLIVLENAPTMELADCTMH